jgi:hypothetical protein
LLVSVASVAQLKSTTRRMARSNLRATAAAQEQAPAGGAGWGRQLGAPAAQPLAALPPQQAAQQQAQGGAGGSSSSSPQPTRCCRKPVARTAARGWPQRRRPATCHLHILLLRPPAPRAGWEAADAAGCKAAAAPQPELEHAHRAFQPRRTGTPFSSRRAPRAPRARRWQTGGKSRVHRNFSWRSTR